MNQKKILLKILSIEASIRQMNQESFYSSLIGGTAGISFFYYLMYKSFVNDKYKDLAISSLFKSVRLFNESPSDTTFANGILGIGWLIQTYSNDNLISDDQSIILKDIDEIALKSLNESPIYDLFYGVIGIGQYYLQRQSKRDISIELSMILDYFEASAIRYGDKISWANYFSVERENESQVAHDLGLAHGNPSIIMFLLNVYKTGFKQESCRKLIDGSLKWLLQFKTTELMQFPSRVINNNIIEKGNTLAWCYGDLGVALAFINAGIILGNNGYLSVGHDIARKTTFVKFNESGIRKSGDNYETAFCHGTSGIAHIYSVMYLLTNDIIFENSRKYWVEKTLSNELYLFNHVDSINNVDTWVESNGLLSGLSGVGSVLLYEIEPKTSLFIGKIFQTIISNDSF
jgi:lantibiotic modifying enzyme